MSPNKSGTPFLILIKLIDIDRSLNVGVHHNGITTHSYLMAEPTSNHLTTIHLYHTATTLKSEII